MSAAGPPTDTWVERLRRLLGGGGAPASGPRPTPTRSFTRGDYVFTVHADGRGESVTLSRDGRQIAYGRFEPFAPAYMASRRYQQTFHHASPKPVGRIGDVFIGPDAARELLRAIESLRAEREVVK